MTQRQLYTSVMVGMLALLLAGCPAASSNSTPLPDLGGRIVKVAMPNDYPPFDYINPQTGQPEGWDYDVIAELARRLNFVPQYETVTFAQLIDSVSAGTYDLASNGISQTYQRSLKVDFSRPYMIVRQRLLVRADESRVETLVQFKADTTLSVGALTGSTNYDTAASFLDGHPLTGYDSMDQAIVALLTGQVDVVVADDVAFYAQSDLHPNQIKHVPGVLYGDLLGMIMPKGSDLVAPISLALTAMEQDGTLQAFNDKWISRSVIPG